MPTLRRAAKRSEEAQHDGLHVDESTRALETVAANLESVTSHPESGVVEALGVVNDATEVVARKADDAIVATKEAVAPKVASKGRSKLPTVLQFPLVTLLSFSVSSLCYSFLNEWSGGELMNVGKSLDTWGEVGILAGWRISELALGWFGNFDGLDLAALNLLAHGPAFYLLSTLYNISTPTVLSALGIEMLSTFAPFTALRPLSGAHAPGSKGVANREIITDAPIQIYTTLLSALIYGITLFIALHTFLPTSLILYFENIPSLTPAYTANYLTILPITLAFGFAARTFIFTPFAATGRSKEDGRLGEFDPVTATLGETVAFNLWGYTSRAKVIILRTGVAMAVTGINTYLQTHMTVGGVETRGAAAYALPWVGATFFTGLALAFVGGEA